jgi:uncharacterized membrane protein
MLQRLKYYQRLIPFLTLAFAGAICCSLVAFRIHHTDRYYFLFLIWNLFLAFIPYVISTYMVVRKEQFSLLKLLPFYFAWLLFFPNAPYILTDMLHLEARDEIGIWYDMGLILSFAVTGLMIGYLSLIDIFEIAKTKVNKSAAWLLTIFNITAGSFGVYVGRYLRYNSWDLIVCPKPLFLDIATRILHPMAHPKTIGVTLIFSGILITGFIVLQQLSNRKEI